MALDVDIDTDTTWQELFDTLSDTEQSCIRDALGGELAQTLTQPIVWEDFGYGAETAILPCLEAGTANAVFASGLIGAVEQFFGELSEQEESCFWEAVSGLDVGSLVASGEDPFDEFILCAPHVIYVPILLGLSTDDLSEEEESCFREVFSAPGVTALLISDEDPSEQLIAEMVSCVSQPSADAGPPLSLDEYAAWCSQLSQISETLADEDINPAEVAEVLAAAKAVSPPGQVSDWHARVIILLRALVGLVGSEPEWDLSIFFRLFGPLALVQEAEDGLPADVRARLVEVGCIDDSGESEDDHGNDFDRATAIAVGEAVEGSLGVGGDRDAFVFQAGANQNYEVRLGSYSFGSIGSAIGALIAVYGSDGQELARSDDQRFFVPVAWQSGAAGSYYVVVGDGAKNGNYTLTVQLGGVPAPEVIQAIPTPESLGVAPATPAPAAGIDDHGDDIASATVINVGEVVAGVVNGEDDTDFFGFVVEAGQTYHMEVMIDEKPDSVWFQFVILTNSQGMEIGWGDFQLVNKWEGGQLIQWEAPDSGDFYVGIEPGFKGWDPGSTYTLTITAAGQ